MVGLQSGRDFYGPWLNHGLADVMYSAVRAMIRLVCMRVELPRIGVRDLFRCCVSAVPAPRVCMSSYSMPQDYRLGATDVDIDCGDVVGGHTADSCGRQSTYEL
jgi:hypothetical protein